MTYILAASIEGPPCEICHFKVLYYSKEKYSAAMTCLWWSRPIYWQQVWRDLLVKDVTLTHYRFNYGTMTDEVIEHILLKNGLWVVFKIRVKNYENNNVQNFS